MIDIDFKWPKARAYEWEDASGERILRPLGGRRYPVEPFKIEGDKALYIRFSELDGTEKSCLDFAAAYGALTEELPNKAETLSGWKREIQKMKSMMRVLGVNDATPGGMMRTKSSRPVVAPLPSISVTLVPGPVQADGSFGRPKMLLGPKNLVEAMYLQLGKFVAGDGILRTCKQCSSWFEAGATEGRRSIAVFCSEKCKNRFHYLERAKR
jgi:hypothetical protein